MIKKNDTSVKLDKINCSIRSSQALYQYGPGGLIDFRDQTLMTAAPEYWDEKELTKIDDERLAKSLKVDYFKMPGGRQNSTISYVRFPEWYFCPKCKKFQKITKWARDYKKHESPKIVENDPYMVKHMRCPTCRKQELVVTRLVTVCNNGHINDFPWASWVHACNFGGPVDICDNPDLQFSTTGGSGGLSGMIIDCKTCGAKANLSRSFDPKTFEELDKRFPYKYNFKCQGGHPWKKIYKSNCDCYPRAMQRGSSSVYYPFTVKSLVIPPFSDKLNSDITKSIEYGILISTINSLREAGVDSATIEKFIESSCKKIASEINFSNVNQIKDIIKRKLNTDNDNIPLPDSIQYKLDEYMALKGLVKSIDDNKNDFKLISTNIEDYRIPFLKKVSLVTKIKEVRAQIGFTRVKPAERKEEGTNPTSLVRVKEEDTNWYPAYQVFGEGIFIELDQSAIDKWEEQNEEIKIRAERLNKKYKEAYSSSARNITPRFLLLHTISHLLIKQLSFECGYNIASLSERLYCSNTVGDMAGILIYTSDGDSEGTLGGLVRQGRKDTFPIVYKKAIESAMTCSNDPVCSLSNGQGRDSLNLAACHSCTLIPETSCEEFNELLDRGAVAGTFDHKDIGFYSEYLYNGKEWDCTVKSDKKTENTEAEVIKNILETYDGTSNQALNFSEIWTNAIEWASNDDDKEVLKKLSESPVFDNSEKPDSDVSFKIKGNDKQEYLCDFVWDNAKVMLFSDNNIDDYNVAKTSDYECFILSEKDLINKLFIAINGE